MHICVKDMVQMLIKYFFLLAYELQFHIWNSSGQNQLCQNIFFDKSEKDSALCTWQFYILAADSSRPNTVQKSMMTWNMCLFIDLFVSVELYKKAALVFNYNLYETIFKPNTLWDACTILSDDYKSTSSFVCFWLVRKLYRKGTMNFTLWIIYWLSYNPLLLNICLMN